MKIKLRSYLDVPHEKFNFDWAHYSKDNRAFLRAFPKAVFHRCTPHNMNYIKLPNGFLVHVYHCYEVK